MPRRFLLLLAPFALASAAEPVTYSKHVAPILYQNCAGCHRPNDIAPMSLLSYKETRPWARAIREAVASRTMPPWHADPKYGHFANDMRLPEADIATIKAWADAGAPEGNARDLPPLPKFPEGWSIGKPDLVLDIGQDYKISPEGPDEYTYFTVPTNFTEDKWVTAVEMRPGNRRVVHHGHVSIENAVKSKLPKDTAPALMYKDATKLGHMKPDAPIKNDGCAVNDAGNYYGRREGQNGILASYLPGKAADVYPSGTAKRIPAGATLKFQLHYSRTTGKAETDRTQVAFIFAPAPTTPLRRMDISNYLFEIPPGADSAPVTECHTFDRDIQLLSLTAHMHFRGKDMRFDLQRPDGTQETLLNVPHYSFQWQQIYRLAQPVQIPAGSRLIITAHFDNSPNNRFNPDPQKTIRWGEPSNEEMMDGWLEYIDKPTATAARQ